MASVCSWALCGDTKKGKKGKKSCLLAKQGDTLSVLQKKVGAIRCGNSVFAGRQDCFSMRGCGWMLQNLDAKRCNRVSVVTHPGVAFLCCNVLLQNNF